MKLNRARIALLNILLPTIGATLVIGPSFIRQNHNTLMPEFGTPRILTGDEPHYLLLIHSLLDDFDLDLKNNYLAASKGGFQAGVLYSGEPLDHHTTYFIGDQKHYWPQYFDRELAHWTRNQEGFPIPPRRVGLGDDVDRYPEYLSHAPGLPILLAPLLWPWRGTPWVESMAVILCGIAVWVGLFELAKLIQGFTETQVKSARYRSYGAALSLLLMTPMWFYAKTLYSEPLIFAFLMTAYHRGLVRKSGLWAGICAGVIAHLKLPALLATFPIAFYFAWQRNAKQFVRFALSSGFLVSLLFILNRSLFGSFFVFPLELHWGNFWAGLYGLWLSPEHGILMLSPAVLVVFWLWPNFIRRNPARGFSVGAGFLIYFLLIAQLEDWPGGNCYGPRYLAPVLPLLFMPLGVAIAHWAMPRFRVIKAGVFCLITASVLCNGWATVFNWTLIRRHPLSVWYLAFDPKRDLPKQ